MARSRFGTSTIGACAECRGFGRTLGIDVNPLVVGGRLGELIDAVLVDHDPVGHADLDALERLRVVY